MPQVSSYQQCWNCQCHLYSGSQRSKVWDSILHINYEIIFGCFHQWELTLSAAPEQLPADRRLQSFSTPGTQLLLHTLIHTNTHTVIRKHTSFPPVFLHMGNSSIQNTHIPHAKVSTSYKLKHTQTHTHKNTIKQVYVCVHTTKSFKTPKTFLFRKEFISVIAF